MKHLILFAALVFSCANASVREQHIDDGLTGTVPYQVRVTCPMAEGFSVIVTLEIISSDGDITDDDMDLLTEQVCDVLDENPELLQEIEYE